MAREKEGDEPARESSTAASPLSNALLFATLCIVGLPVDVLVKDGSVYSGVFHTACLQDGYGENPSPAKPQSFPSPFFLKSGILSDLTTESFLVFIGLIILFCAEVVITSDLYLQID